MIALVLSVRVSPQETIVDYNNMTTVVIMNSGKKIHCHQAVVNYDNTTSVVVYNNWGKKTAVLNNGEIKNLLHVRDVQ